MGEFYEKRESYDSLITRLKIEENVNIINRYLPNEELESYLTAADLVVLPYISASQSGILQLAFSSLTPVIVTDVGGLPEVVKDGHTGYIVPSRSSDALAKAIVKFFSEGEKISWKKILRVN